MDCCRVTSGTLEMVYSSVTVTASNTIGLPNAISVPSWLVSGYNTVMLSSMATQGFISGYVTDGLGMPIATPAKRNSCFPVGGVSVNASPVNGSLLFCA